jgi:signal transduction histidine kinase
VAAAEKFTLEDDWLLQRETAVAWLRVVFAVVAVLVIQPERVTRFPLLSSFSLSSFLIYSIAVLYLAKKNRLTARPIDILTNSLDVVWIALIVFSTGGTHTPFFFYYSFPVITAGLRWGLKGSVPVALVGVIVYGIVRLTLAAESMEPPIGIDMLLVRSLYLIVLAGIFGYVSQFERQQNRRLLALSKTAGKVATLQERRRIIFELHDGILQSLATLILRLEGCRKHLPDSEKQLIDEMRSLENLTRDSMKEIRQFLAGESTKNLVAGTLVEKLREEARFLRDGMGLDVILESEPEDLELSAETEREVYYVLREALTNVIRHSHASKVDIHLTQKNDQLAGSLTDNGVGFSTGVQRENSFGLAAMAQRVREIGGEFFVKSSPGSGTQVTFFVPATQT